MLSETCSEDRAVCAAELSGACTVDDVVTVKLDSGGTDCVSVEDVDVSEDVEEEVELSETVDNETFAEIGISLWVSERGADVPQPHAHNAVDSAHIIEKKRFIKILSPQRKSP